MSAPLIIERDIVHGSAEWLAARGSYLGGTDSAAIVGLNKWKSALEVFLEKTGQLGERAKHPLREIKMRMGSALENLAAEIYAEVTGYELEAGYLVRHPEHSFLGGNPDRLIKGEKRGLEVKTFDYFTASEWGPGNDEEQLGKESDMVPHAYWIQGHWYLWLFDYDAWDFIGLNRSTGEWKIYTCRRNDAALELIVPRCVEFWKTKVEPFRRGEDVEPPEPTECDLVYIHGAHPVAKGESITSDAKCDEWAMALKRVRSQLKPLSAQEKDLKAKLQNFMGDAAELCTLEGTFRWKNNKDSIETNWENIARPFLTKLPPETAAALLSVNTRTVTGDRKFYCPNDWK